MNPSFITKTASMIPFLSKWTDLQTRVRTSLLLLLSFVIAFLAQPLGLYIWALGLILGSLKEITSPLIHLLSFNGIFCVGLLTFAAVLYPPVAVLLTISLCLCLRAYHEPFQGALNSPGLLATIFGALFTFIALSAYHIASIIHSSHLTPLLFSIGVAASVDIFGYGIGQFFGSQPLNWKISPKKTKIGYIGSFFFTSLLFTQGGSVSLKDNFMVMGMIIFSIIGDLGFSLPKRLANIKDYSQSLPGHGGLLDRLDSIFGVLFFVQIIDSFPGVVFGFL